MQEFLVSFAQYLIQGISLGSIYALIALGYTMVYGILRLINFAHGDVFMLGSYTGLFFASFWLNRISPNHSFFPSLILSMTACAVIGVVIEKMAYKPLRQKPKMMFQAAGIGACFGFFAFVFFKWDALLSILLLSAACGMIGYLIEKNTDRKVTFTVTVISGIITGLTGSLGYKTPLFQSLSLSIVFFILFLLTFNAVHKKPFKPAPRIAYLITAIGVSLFLEYAMMYWQTPNQKYFPDILQDATYEIKLSSEYSIYIFRQHIIFLAVSLSLALLLWLLVNHTKIGRAMRAVSYDWETSALMGVNVNNVISVTFAIGSALAGAAGVLFACFYPFDPLLGIMPGLKAFIAAVLGGIGSLPGAILGGILLGTAEQMVVGFGNSALRDVVAFVILIIVLMLRPKGLINRGSSEM